MAEPLKTPLTQAEIVVLQGNDALSIKEAIQSITTHHASEAFAGMNSVRLDGQSVQQGELSNHINMLPLGGTKRLVIVDNALDGFKAKSDKEWLSKLVTTMPVSTVLVLLIPDEKKWKNGEMVWQAVGEGHWLRKALKESKKAVGWVEALLPSQREMPDWIMKEAQKQGAQMDGSAAAELANLVGSDLFQARQEIDKAFSYCGKDKPITRDVVRLLCSQSREEDIFDMMDAAGQRDSRKALFLLRELMKDQPIQYIFIMLVRQVRLLIMAKEALDEGGSEMDVIKTCGMASFVAKKMINQSRRFKMAELESIFQRLDKMDEDSKTGNSTLDVDVEMLVAELSR